MSREKADFEQNITTETNNFLFQVIFGLRLQYKLRQVKNDLNFPKRNKKKIPWIFE